MGTYRFFLSILVLLSHVGIYFFGVNTGVSAVISFLLISGYSMQILLDNYYNEKKNIKYFYIDRAIRIFPLAWTYMIFTLILLKVNPITNVEFISLVENFTIPNVLLNFMIIPLDYYMFISGKLAGAMIIPQAWTLGLEFSFYLIFPAIYFSKKWKLFSFVSFIIFLLACFNIINNDWYGYRLIFGTLFIFLIGANIKKIGIKKIIILWLIVFSLYVNTFINPQFSFYISNSVLLGLLIGLPMIKMLSNIKVKNKFDDLLGSLSYGIYLNHWFIIFFFNRKPENEYEIIGFIILSIILSFITNMFIEMPKEKFRKKYRNKKLA